MAVTVNGGAPSAPQIAEFQSVFQVAPAGHVASGGAAHANAVAAGAAGFMTGADKTKLDGIATAATANSADATLLARANHTGTQAASTISDFNSASRAQTEAELIAGTGITITPGSSGATRTLTLASTGGAGVTDGDKGDITVSGSGATWTVDNGFAATKIADGTVTNAEFQYLGGVTSDIQTQLNAKLDADLANDLSDGTAIAEDDELPYIDVSAADAVLKGTVSVLRNRLATIPIGTALGTTGSVALDFATLGGTRQSITLTGNLTLTTSNLAAGRGFELRIAAGASGRTITYPAWVPFGAALPTSLASGEVLILSLFANSTTDGSVDAVAVVSA